MNNNKGNFFSIIQFLAKYDTDSDKLLQLPKGSPKYLSPLIQNELISVSAEEVLGDIKSKLHSDPFFDIIPDTNQNVSKKDQLSEVFRYVKINYPDDGTPQELKVLKRLPHSSMLRIHLLLDIVSSFLSNASHLDLEVEARKFSNTFFDNVSPLFPSQMLSTKTSFREKIAHLKSAKEMASFFDY